MRFYCWFFGHRWNVLTGICSRCHVWVYPQCALPVQALELLARAAARYINAQAAILEQPRPKPEVEVMPTLPEEVAELLQMAREQPAIRARLPEEYRRMLEEEEESWETAR